VVVVVDVRFIMTAMPTGAPPSAKKVRASDLAT
jgi:hypothetical protein